MNDYTHPTAKYDESGRLEELYCKCCGTLIGKIDESLSRKYPEKITILDDGKTIVERFTEKSFKFIASYKQIFVTMADGSYATIAVCAECENKDHDVQKLSDVLIRENDEAMKQARRPQVEIDLQKVLWKRDKKIVKHIRDNGDLKAVKDKLNLSKIGRVK